MKLSLHDNNHCRLGSLSKVSARICSELAIPLEFYLKIIGSESSNKGELQSKESTENEKRTNFFDIILDIILKSGALMLVQLGLQGERARVGRCKAKYKVEKSF